MDRPAALVIALSGALVRALPRPLALLLGRALGLLGYLLAGRRRRLALDNLRIAFPDLSARARRRLARSSFAHLGMNVVEFFSLPRLTREGAARLMPFEGEEHMDRARALGRGVLMLSTHLGSWDLLSAALVLRGYRLALVSKVSRSRAVNRVWMGYRARAGIRVLTGRNLMRGILSSLRGGGMVGFVLDQNAIRADGVFVPFFGRSACTLSALAVIAARTGAPVVPVHTYRDGGRHRAMFHPPIEVPGAPAGEEGITARTAAYTRWTEQVIRRHPGQWTWLHDRWKTRPPAEPEVVQGPKSKVQGKGSGQEPGSTLDIGPWTLDMTRKRPAVFFDRDGTLIDELGYLGDPEKVPGKLFPWAAEAVRAAAEAGYLPVLVTNQSAVGRGMFPEEAVTAVNLRLAQELVKAGGAAFTAAYHCPHLPDAGCDCRKPALGMARRAAADLGLDLSRSWVVGDVDKDVLLAARAGMKAALVRTGHPQKGDIPPGTPVFDDALAAVRHLVREGGL